MKLKWAQAMIVFIYSAIMNLAELSRQKMTISDVSLDQDILPLVPYR